MPLPPKKKLFGFLECDTIFSGDFTRDGKIHTLENLVRGIGVLLLILFDNIYAICCGIVLVGFTAIPAIDDENKVDLKLW